ncbi:MAG: SocA family protein [Deltaproteobacteria bacterium]|nr:SocA family protein [Deltaproteobacteria bacterium]
MEFKYNPLKTVQAAGLFLKLNKRAMEYMKLIKLLYLTDRIALDKMGATITGDKYVSMNHCPILSKIYDMINHGPIYDKDNPWFKYISPPQNYCVRLSEDPGNDELCEEEKNIIKKIYKTCGNIDVWELSNSTHFFPEWQNPYGSAIPIKIEEILSKLGKTEDDIKAIRENITRENHFDMLLAY